MGLPIQKGITIAAYLQRYALHAPKQIALIVNDDKYSYNDLKNVVDQLARALLAAGVKQGDKVAILCTTCAEYWITFLATTSIGVIWLGLNPKYKLPEIRYVLEDAKPKLLFAMAGFEGYDYSESINQIQSDYDFIERVISITEPLPDTQPFTGFMEEGSSVSDAELHQRQSAVEPMDPALLVYTSGSTGKPKGALLSHYGLCFGAEVQAQHYAVENPVMLCNFPINHVACVADTCCVNLVAGGTLVLQERFDVDQVLHALRHNDLNVILMVPTMVLVLLEHPDFNDSDLVKLELLAWGGAPLPVPIIERLQKIVPRLMNVYGMTETAANTTYSDVDADLIQLSETIGRPSPHMPCRIMNDLGTECEIGEEGELQFKGEYLLLEYLNRPDATRDVYTEDGWLHTGDLGYWRDNGTITLVGRKSDMFKSGGYNVYPREIENHLESHPAIEMAAVVAVPDARFQEVGAAFIVLSQAEDSVDISTIKGFCAEHLANYKVPKTMTIVDQLPVLPVGKVDKVQLKQQAVAALNATQKELV